MNVQIPLHIQRKYVPFLSTYIDKFKRQASGICIGRCPFCGDSTKNPNKRRFYVLEKGNSIMYYCHNCRKSGSFQWLLKTLCPHVLKDMFIESLKECGKYIEPNQKKIIDENALKAVDENVDRENVLKSYKTCDKLDIFHPANQYLQKRNLINCSANFYYTDRYGDFARELKFHNTEKLKNDERIVLICRDSRGKILGCIGRSLDKNNKLRYISNVSSKNQHNFYGLDKISIAQTIYVCEGAIDSMMLKNCVAVCCADLDMIEKVIPDAKERCVLISDNERRKKEIMTRMEKFIRGGWNVVMFPDNLNKYKDLNDMIVKGGLSKNDLEKIIKDNIYNGIRAHLKFNTYYNLIKDNK